ncbi:40S ribosomal protein S27.2 [Carassius carassius]|uniref:40S ribosomal protein S27.2 n=1 Tax=Carassius carassius TaxID=217509 RepID=UPI00286953E7|nr:40S ribosomal protein S27.2 [Carassius carassius]
MLLLKLVRYFLPLLSSPVHMRRVFPPPPLFGCCSSVANMPLAKDLLLPTPEEEKRRHKKKRLVQSPNSYFMDVKCPGCYKITTVFSHAQTVVLCVGCSTVLCQPTGGKARLTEGCSFRRKQH